MGECRLKVPERAQEQAQAQESRRGHRWTRLDG